MCTFLNVQFLDTKRSYQMFAHYSCVFPFHMKKLRTLNTTMQVQEIIWMLNELIQAIQMVFMKSWTIEQYGAGIGDDFDAIMN